MCTGMLLTIYKQISYSLYYGYVTDKHKLFIPDTVQTTKFLKKYCVIRESS